MYAADGVAARDVQAPVAGTGSPGLANPTPAHRQVRSYSDRPVRAYADNPHAARPRGQVQQVGDLGDRGAVSYAAVVVPGPPGADPSPRRGQGADAPGHDGGAGTARVDCPARRRRVSLVVAVQAQAPSVVGSPAVSAAAAAAAVSSAGGTDAGRPLCPATIVSTAAPTPSARAPRATRGPLRSMPRA